MSICRRYFLVWFWLFVTFCKCVCGQNLSFSPPVNFLPGAVTRNAIDITQFKHTHFVTYNDARDGSIHVTWLGKQYADASDYDDVVINGSQSRFAPVLRATADHLYVLWIAGDGGIRYAINSSDTGFRGASSYSLTPASSLPAAMGLTAADMGDRIVLTTRSTGKDLLYAVTGIGPDGRLLPAELKTTGLKSSDFPFVVALSPSTIRMTWRGYKDEKIYFADNDLARGAWTAPQPFNKWKTKVSPAAYRVFDSDKLFYVWKGSRNDNRLYYSTGSAADLPTAATGLPAYFSPLTAVSICNIDKKRFILAYPGADGKLYLSWFVNYNAARWMEETLYPAKASYSLRDIALPGAHDAGMSVLTATGGQQPGTINECNTLTQTQDIKSQLNAGIRMFDLRIGYYDNAYYTKHCSSDCMSEAIGGGYGEKLGTILYALRNFLSANRKETVILSFSHFCESEASAAKVAQYITDTLGKEFLFAGKGKKLSDIPLSELAGKAIVVFEQYASVDRLIDSCSIASSSGCFVNFRREYAATNVLTDLQAKEKAFFVDLAKARPHDNDLVRLDWQLTQIADEAAMICNDFQSEDINPLINGAMLLTNVLRKHRSIRDLSLAGNKSVLQLIRQWMDDGTIDRYNKPNIMYVDIAGGWITDFCIQLNDHPLYGK